MYRIPVTAVHFVSAQSFYPLKKAPERALQPADKVHFRKVGFVFYVEKRGGIWYNRSRKRVMKC